MTTWTIARDTPSPGQVTKLRLLADDRALRHAEVLALWQTSHEFRRMFLDALAGQPFAAFRWETPAITAATIEREFECVVIDAPELLTSPDQDAFDEHFERGVEGVVVFPNLRGDATLIAPCPVAPAEIYAHLAAFVRGAPEPQQHALVEQIGRVTQRLLSTRPIWLSTAGAGVAWLHVRLDTRPKYYAHLPYRAAPR
jgi:hypothetical protein